MENSDAADLSKPSSLRWALLRRALLRHPSPVPCDESRMGMERISRKTLLGFNMIPSQRLVDLPDDVSASLTVSNQSTDSNDALVCYTLPTHDSPKLFLIQRGDNRACLNDFEICNKHNIDNTGLVCHWPSEDVLAYFCLSHVGMFRSRRVLELGSGYGLAGLVIAVTTEATEVVISDGNPQVVDYVQRNIDINSRAFGGTTVNSMLLHWDQGKRSDLSGSFDIIIASDCTFFEEFHKGLAETVKSLLKEEGWSEAILMSPKRGSTLNGFLGRIEERDLRYSVNDKYDVEVWRRHERFMHGGGGGTWSNYEMDHCYPLLVRISC